MVCTNGVLGSTQAQSTSQCKLAWLDHNIARLHGNTSWRSDVKMGCHRSGQPKLPCRCTADWVRYSADPLSDGLTWNLARAVRAQHTPSRTPPGQQG